jgi:predicted  nucleic acid-binding Zn-ribbon protein
MIMKEQIYQLVKLQKIETETGNIRTGLNQVSKKLETLDGELREFKQTLEDQEAFVDELKKKYRDYETEAQINVSRMAKTKEKLVSVKSNREYQALLKELEDGEAKHSEVEDQMLECLDRLDEIEKAIAEKKEDRLELSERIKSEKEKINRETQLQQTKLADLDADREGICGTIKPNLLEKYNHIKTLYSGGLVMVPVKNAVCQGCNMNIFMKLPQSGI